MTEKKRKSLIVIDIDGTIMDFKSIDNNIVNNVFGKSKLVTFFDKILWKINSLDVISNNIIILNLRILFYSIISFTNPFKAFILYSFKYEELAKIQVTKKLLSDIDYLKTLADEVVFVTHDFHAYCLEKVLNTRIITKNKIVFFPRLHKQYDIKYVIGNNYMDDILPGKKLRKENGQNIKVVYIGKSKLLKKVSNIFIYDTFDDFISVLKNS